MSQENDYVQARAESWFTLASGRRFRPFAPRVEDVHIEDIALALSHVCRFNGHCLKFYSVAEHSVHCSEVVPREFAFAALMHDATEAFCGDMITPIKKYDETFSEMEAGIWVVICDRYNLPLELPDIVKWADAAVLKAEARDLLAPFGEAKFPTIHVDPPPGLIIRDSEAGIEPWEPTKAKLKFLERFNTLYQAR